MYLSCEMGNPILKDGELRQMPGGYPSPASMQRYGQKLRVQFDILSH